MPREVKFIINILLRRWYWLLTPIGIVGLWVGYSLLTAPPAVSGGYTTVVRFSAAQSIDAIPNRDGDYQDVWLSSELTVKALTSWAMTTSFKREVAARVAAEGVTFAPEALPVAVDQQRSIGQLFISWPDADELTLIAEAALVVLREDSATYFPQFGDAPAQVTVLDDIRVQPAPPPIVDRFEPLVQMVLAAVLGLFFVTAVSFLDPALYERYELEQLGLDVIVSVPRE